MNNMDRAFFMVGGDINISNLKIQNGNATGGSGGNLAGGGAGLGGAIFVANGPAIQSNLTMNTNVTLTNVTFSNNAAVGGAGGNYDASARNSGGGGMGGNGASVVPEPWMSMVGGRWRVRNRGQWRRRRKWGRLWRNRGVLPAHRRDRRGGGRRLRWWERRRLWRRRWRWLGGRLIYRRRRRGRCGMRLMPCMGWDRMEVSEAEEPQWERGGAFGGNGWLRWRRR